MKARVKETGEIVSVQLVEKKYSYSGRWIFFYEDGEGRRYVDNKLDFDNTDNTPEDYWTRLEHQYAGMAMQGLLSSSKLNIIMDNSDVLPEGIAIMSRDFAHALVEKLKEKEERK